MIRQDISLADLQRLNINMTKHLGIEYLDFGTDFIRAKMPVDERTTQPMGILHGGASVVLAESLGSIGANLCIDESKFYCVGLEINANHIRSVGSGKWVIGTAKPLHVGRTTQIWEIRITDETDKLICVSRLTVAVIEKK